MQEPLGAFSSLLSSMNKNKTSEDEICWLSFSRGHSDQKQAEFSLSLLLSARDGLARFSQKTLAFGKFPVHQARFNLMPFSSSKAARKMLYF